MTELLERLLGERRGSRASAERAREPLPQKAADQAVHRTRTPLWAKGVISSSRHVSGGALRVESVEIEFDSDANLEVIVCPRLFVVAVEDRDQIEFAVAAIQRRQRSPRDKGVLILPFGSKFSMSPDTAKTLAMKGVLVKVSAEENLREGAQRYVREFMERRVAGRENMDAFMSRQP